MGCEELELSASLEDYLEAIHNLSAKTGAVRSKDIADNLGVARASVTGALRLLKDKGLANYEPYGPVTLTESGQKIASEVAAKHRVLKAFFVNVLGVNRQDAQRGACRAEHALGGTGEGLRQIAPRGRYADLAGVLQHLEAVQELLQWNEVDTTNLDYSRGALHYKQRPVGIRGGV